MWVKDRRTAYVKKVKEFKSFLEGNRKTFLILHKERFKEKYQNLSFDDVKDVKGVAAK